MRMTLSAIYQDGKLVLPHRLPLPENSHVRMTIQTEDSEREAWLALSEQSLLRSCDNAADDIFDELLSR
jgi:hypothetical protein